MHILEPVGASGTFKHSKLSLRLHDLEILRNHKLSAIRVRDDAQTARPHKQRGANAIPCLKNTGETLDKRDLPLTLNFRRLQAFRFSGKQGRLA